MTKSNSKNDYRLALFLLLVSGAAALGHQLVWTRRMLDLLGASVESTTRVFGSFFLGLAFGAALIAVLLPGIKRPWRALGIVELGVAAACLPMLFLPEWTGWIWPALGPERFVGWQGAVIKLLLSLLNVVPPAVFMGMTLPLMVSAACTSQITLSRHGVWLYAVNTAGGLLGIALAVGVLLQVSGVAGTMLTLVALNALVAAACFSKDRSMSVGEGQAFEVASDESATSAPPATVYGISFLSGAGVLAIEVLSLEMLHLKAPLSFYPPSVILFCVILMLALGAAVVPGLIKRFGEPQRVTNFCLAAAAVAIVLVPVLFMGLEFEDREIGYGRGFSQFLLTLLFASLMSLGPAMVLAGMVFPCCVAWVGRNGGLSGGRTIGALLAINGVGGFFGAEVAYRLLLPTFGVHVAIGVVAIAYGVTSLAFSVTARPQRRSGAGLLMPVAANVLVVLILITKVRELPVFFAPGSYRVLDVKSSREGALAVVENDNLGRVMVFNNQYLLGGSKTAPDEERQAHIPLLLHRNPEQVALVGLGTGITGGGALLHGAVKTVTAVELSQLVADAARNHFSEFNRNMCNATNATVLVEDARTFIEASRGRFDVVIGDLVTPWRPGAARLYTVEHFRAARNALKTDGVFCQWLPMHQLTAEHFAQVAASFESIFGKAYVFRNHLMTKSIPLALVGFKNGELDWNTVTQRCAFEKRHGTLLDPVCRHSDGIAMLYLGQLLSVPNSAMNTLGNMQLELKAGKQVVAGNPEEYFSGTSVRWLELMQSHLANLDSDADVPDKLKQLAKVGLTGTILAAAIEQNGTSIPTWKERFEQGFPDAVFADLAADWLLWSGPLLFHVENDEVTDNSN